MNQPTTDTPDTERAIRRILVALDASAHSLAAVEAAARLAEEVDAELEGLFIEDVSLIRLARLGLTREIDVLSARLRDLESRPLERQLRQQGARAHRQLKESAGERRLVWKFRRVRGRVIPELQEAAQAADLVILGVRGWSPGRGPGSTVRALLQKPETPVMVLGRSSRLGKSVFAVFGGSPDGRRALQLAGSLASSKGASLTVLLVPEEGAEAEALELAAAQILGPLEIDVEFRRLVPGQGARLAHVVRAEGCGLFVVPRPPLEAEGQEGESVRDMLAELDCPVLMVG